MKTDFYLMGRYGSLPIIPVDKVVEDFFTHLTVPMFLRKTASGELKLPVVKLGPGQKAARGVPLQHLADYLDQLTEEACKVAGIK